MKRRLTTRQVVLAGLMGALLMVLKEVLAPVPGVEPVTLLVILYAPEREAPARTEIGRASCRERV